MVILNSSCAKQSEPYLQFSGTDVVKLETTKLTDHATVYTAQPWNANSLVVEMPNGTLVLVDTPPTPAATATLLNMLDQQYGKRRILAVNGHYHADGTGGNQVLRRRNIDIYATPLTRSLLLKSGNEMLTQIKKQFKDKPLFQNAFEQIVITPANNIVDIDEGSVRMVHVGDEHFALVYAGPAHTPDNIAVYFPNEKVLYGGCILKAGDNLGYIEEADLDSYPKVIWKLMKFQPDYVVSGHSQDFSPKVLQNTLVLAIKARREQKEK